jgi:hypothetical protein
MSNAGALALTNIARRLRLPYDSNKAASSKCLKRLLKGFSYNFPNNAGAIYSLNMARQTPDGSLCK